MGLFRLVEPLEQMRYAVGIYALAGILDRYRNDLFLYFGDKPQAAALRRKLYGVIYEIPHHLGYLAGVRLYGYLLRLHIQLHIELFGVHPRLECEHGPHYQLVYVKYFFLYHYLARLYSGQIKQVVHH